MVDYVLVVWHVRSLPRQVSGIPHADDFVVYLDGVDWTPADDIGFDRWHYDILFEEGLTEGEHVLESVLRNREIQGQARLCSVEVLEYGFLEEFVASPGYYSLFPTRVSHLFVPPTSRLITDVYLSRYDLDNATSYHPTNDNCLMRSVVKPNFCNVCLEGLWLSLVKRIDPIEGLSLTCSGPRSDVHVVQVDLVKLAQFREEPIASAESYAIEWTRNGWVLEALANSLGWN